jgi:hypothetical protein
MVELVDLLEAVYLVDQVALDLVVCGQGTFGEGLDQSSQFLVDVLPDQFGFVEQAEA